jgi:hypothetical protein
MPLEKNFNEARQFDTRQFDVLTFSSVGSRFPPPDDLHKAAHLTALCFSSYGEPNVVLARQRPHQEPAFDRIL